MIDHDPIGEMQDMVKAMIPYIIGIYVIAGIVWLFKKAWRGRYKNPYQNPEEEEEPKKTKGEK